MPKSAAPEWADHYTQIIAKQVRNYRNLRGLSAQQVSDRCAALGMPIHRSVLANFENGRRDNVSVGEVFCLALVLDVAPINLLTAPDGETEVAPGLVLDRPAATSWIAGLPEPGAVVEAMAEFADAQDEADHARKRLESASQRLRDLMGSEPDSRRTR